MNRIVPLIALCLFLPLAAHAERGQGWDFGADLTFQTSQDINFKGGSTAALDDDFSIALAFGYRFGNRLELTFGLDWNTVDYTVNVASAVPGGLGFRSSGDLESFTPRVGLNFNFMEGDFTPYVSGSVGWAFIDTNIPNGPPQSSCWWDPWYGQICGTWQDTRSFDDFAYSLGAGVRWDVSSTISLRLGYEKHWLDIGQATTTPDFDQFRFGVQTRY